MEDLYRYFEAGYTCTVLRDSAPVYQSRERGVRPLLALIDAGIDVRGCTAADSIVGRAAALLYVYLGVAAVTADVMSVGARGLLSAHGIATAARTVADHIINRRGDGPCPMEAATAGITDPAEALTVIRETAAALRAAAQK